MPLIVPPPPPPPTAGLQVTIADAELAARIQHSAALAHLTVEQWLSHNLRSYFRIS